MSEGFLEPNLNALNLDFVALLRGTSIASTTQLMKSVNADYNHINTRAATLNTFRTSHV